MGRSEELLSFLLTYYFLHYYYYRLWWGGKGEQELGGRKWGGGGGEVGGGGEWVGVGSSPILGKGKRRCIKGIGGAFSSSSCSHVRRVVIKMHMSRQLLRCI